MKKDSSDSNYTASSKLFKYHMVISMQSYFQTLPVQNFHILPITEFHTFTAYYRNFIQTFPITEFKKFPYIHSVKGLNVNMSQFF